MRTGVEYESWRARFYLAGDEELMEEETVSILEPEITVHSCGLLFVQQSLCLWLGAACVWTEAD